MKLKNKQTGEIVDFKTPLCMCDDKSSWQYDSLRELEEDWEDMPEEPEDYWYIDCTGDVIRAVYKTDDLNRSLVAIGNHFETPEEAEKAVEKLEAWKRLRNKGFRFDGWKCTGSISFTFDNYYGDGQPRSASDDLDLLFCPEVKNE